MTDTETTETHLSEALRTLFSDEALQDLQLEGTDGVLVGANRGLLAARSKVFRAMLFGKFSEASVGRVVHIDYDSKVLRSVVQYCLTDEAGMLLWDTRGEQTAEGIVSLADAANYFDLTGLKAKAELFACDMMMFKPETACLFLEESRARFDSAGLIEKNARKEIQLRPLLCLLNERSVACISECTMEDILKDKNMRVSESTLFRALQCWSDNTNEDPPAHRQAVASRLSKHILLDQISPSELSSLVEPSGLVTAQQVLQAYKSQALATEDHNATVWEQSGCDTSECLTPLRTYASLKASTPIRSGKWKWSIKVVTRCVSTWIGVESTVTNERWLYKSSGKVKKWTRLMTCDRRNKLPTFEKEGSVVTIVLDLTEEGTMKASVDGDVSTLLFTNMLKTSREDQEVGFLPAVSTVSPGKVRFLGLEQIE